MHHRNKAAFLAAAVCLVGNAAASQTLPTLQTVHTALNAAARSMDVDSTFGLIECGKEVRATCQIRGNSVSALAIGAEEDEPASSITMIFVPDGDQAKAIDAISSFGILIATASPDLPANERGEILMSLMPAIQDREPREVVSGDLTYRMTMSNIIGLWFIVERDE